LLAGILIVIESVYQIGNDGHVDIESFNSQAWSIHQFRTCLIFMRI
jgi:hypothetical protein